MENEGRKNTNVKKGKSDVNRATSSKKVNYSIPQKRQNKKSWKSVVKDTNRVQRNNDLKNTTSLLESRLKNWKNGR